MPYKISFFRRIVILVFLMLIPVIVVYSYSYSISVKVVETEIENSSMRQLNFFLGQVENNAAQLTSHSVLLSRESSIREVGHLQEITSFVDILMTKKLIEDKLALFSSSSPWKNNISVYSPSSETALSTYPVIDYIMDLPDEEQITRWNYFRGDDHHSEDRFNWYVTDPPAARNNLASANMIVEVSFTTENLMIMLDQFMTDRQGNPFFYAPGQDPIMNRKGDSETIRQLVDILHSRQLDGADQEQMTIAGENYLVSYLPSASLGWYLVDFMPLDKVLQPINTNRNFFYIVIIILLILGISVSSIIYRNVQLPIRELMNNVQKLKRGNYSARLQTKPRNEFHFLFTRFNEMAEQIQQLIENVYTEKIRSREATVKQLQSQINPHFFYNCMFFIVSMSRLGQNKAVEAMATNLGDYFRYTTRVEKQTSNIREELGLVRNYLVIQQLRQQIEFEIQVPEEMLDLPLPRLTLQPLVENAIIHGLEPLEDTGRILINGYIGKEAVILSVEDNGIGMDDAALQELRRKSTESLTEEMGCGVWNVNQRLIYTYGGNSGLVMNRSIMGGLKAELVMYKNGGHHVGTSNSR